MPHSSVLVSEIFRIDSVRKSLYLPDLESHHKPIMPKASYKSPNFNPDVDFVGIG